MGYAARLESGAPRGRTSRGGLGRDSCNVARRAGEKKGSFGDQEPISGDTQGGVMMKAAPAAPFVVPQSHFLLDLLVVALDDPALLGGCDQILALGFLR